MLIDEFTDAFIDITLEGSLYTKDELWQTVKSHVTTSIIQGAFIEKWVNIESFIGSTQNGGVGLKKKYALLLVPSTVTIKRGDRITANGSKWNVDDIKPIRDLEGDIDHLQAFLTTDLI